MVLCNFILFYELIADESSHDDIITVPLQRLRDPPAAAAQAPGVPGEDGAPPIYTLL